QPQGDAGGGRVRRPLALLALLALELASAAGCKRSGLAHGVRELADSDFMAPTPAQALSAHDSNGIADRLTVMNYTIDDERIAGPESVLTGAVEIRLTNRGHSLHELRVLRIGNGQSATGVILAIRQNATLRGMVDG